MSRHLVTALLAFLCLSAAAVSAAAEPWGTRQMGTYEAHFSLVPTTMLNADVVAHYGVTRGRDRALFSLSVLDAAGAAVRAGVTGTMKDLLGQERALALREVVEGDAVYYLAEVKHSDRDVLRFALDVTTPDGGHHRLDFQQTMYWSDR